MGSNIDVGSVAFEPRDGTFDMLVEVDRKRLAVNKFAFWVKDAAGVRVATARRIFRMGKVMILLMEGATGTEALVSAFSYNRLNQPLELEHGTEVVAPDGNFARDIGFRQVKKSEAAGELWVP